MSFSQQKPSGEVESLIKRLMSQIGPTSNKSPRPPLSQTQSVQNLSSQLDLNAQIVRSGAGVVQSNNRTSTTAGTKSNARSHSTQQQSLIKDTQFSGNNFAPPTIAVANSCGSSPEHA
jgi:hypothetical protein